MISYVNQKAAVEAEILRGEENAKCAKTTLLQNHAAINPTVVACLDNVIDSFSSLRLVNLNSPESSGQNTPDLNRIPQRSLKRKRSAECKTYRTNTPIVNDGFSWKKFGQKSIKNFRCKRDYFRCRNCVAKKYEQKIQDSPPVFETIYNGQHTCQAPAFSLNPTDSTMLQFQSSSQAASGSNLSSLAAVLQETIQVEAASGSNLSSRADLQVTIQAEAASGSNLSSLALNQETIQVDAPSGSNLSALAVGQERIQVEAACDSNLPSLIDIDGVMADDWLSYLSSNEETTENDVDYSRF